jgi:predicted nucleotidyltransferase
VNRPQRPLSNVSDLLAAHGPLTGAELLEVADLEVFPLWQTCQTEPGVVMQCAGRRYLRLDEMVEGYARLSPSIRREFLTYTIVGLADQAEQMGARCQELQREFVRISQHKREVARDAIQRIVASSPNGERLSAHFCFTIGGDVTYGMAHTVERPEPSTGKLVRGSDLDVVVVSDEEATAAEREALDERLYKEKWNLLVLPQFREEIDYVVKNISKVLTQLQFDSFRHMVACKILHESKLLAGSEPLFVRIKQLVDEFGIPGKLAELEERAAQERETAEAQLVRQPETERKEAWEYLFFTRDEREDIW